MSSNADNKTLRERLHILRLALSPARIAREIQFRMSGGLRFQQCLQHPALAAAFNGKSARTDISEHLNTLFFAAMAIRPRLIVELGTRGGESTRVFLAAAALTGAKVLSVDIEDCSGLELPNRNLWSFIKTDDIEFGRNGFKQWCAAAGLKPEIDLLFIDTSHLYEHTKQEIQTWFPFISQRGGAAFHDTNMGAGIYGRLDRSVGRYGWDNQRGVIRAIEEFVGRNYDEKRFFTDVAGGFLIQHHPHSNGMTVMTKYSAG